MNYALIPLFIFSLHAVAAAPAPKIDPGSGHRRMYMGPARAADQPAWLSGMKAERDKNRAEFFRGKWAKTAYDEPKLQWAKKNFIQTKVMVHDRYFYDPERRVYTVDRFLADAKNRYGGVDSVLIWPAYPNIGVDSRNQFDLVRDLPGGIQGIKGAIADFHKSGVKVFLPFNPWDEGTRAEKVDPLEALVSMMIETGADGIFADTLYDDEAGADHRFYTLGADRGHPFSVQPEIMESVHLNSAPWTNMSWGYLKDYTQIPGVELFHWNEPRHMVHVTLREAQSHVDELQYAWFNGLGFNNWENIFGVWNGVTPRDAEAVKRIGRIYRAFPEFRSSPEWEPHTLVLQSGVFASKFPHGGATIWQFVNRSGQKKSGTQISLPPDTRRFFNLWTGEEFPAYPSSAGFTLSFELEAGGFGAVLAVPEEEASQARKFIKELNGEWSKSKLADFDSRWRKLQQKMVLSETTQPYAEAPAGMVKIPATEEFNFKVDGIVLEDYHGAGVQFPWEPDHKPGVPIDDDESAPRMEHEHEMEIAAFYIDRTPVTNAEFSAFLQKTNYKPADSHNFVRHWGGGQLPKSLANKPVTWVAIEDARAYCQAMGKRLPNDWEWQYAAQGTDGRSFPWGNSYDKKRVPAHDLSRNPRLPDDVGSFPSGKSPFGVLDMSGLVWQYTNEFRDERNRRALLRGGSYYRPQGSSWYFPHTAGQGDKYSGYFPNKLSEHGNYLLMAPSLDRAGTIGFRCAADSTK